MTATATTWWAVRTGARTNRRTGTKGARRRSMITSSGMPASNRMTTAAACAMAPAEIMADCCCCKRCGIGGCDIKILDCNCCLHARCMPISESRPLVSCPVCRKPARSMVLIPMKFDELDKAQAEAAMTELSDKRGKKRQNATISRLDPERNTEDTSMSGSGSGELRTGRWTTEETEYCDKLIELFETGSLPIPSSLKLNDFLSLMLKSKQSRLTKKMKNAKLSSRQYQHKLGYIESTEEATAFSQLETQFFKSIRCNMERSEIRFHMQKVWRELFSAYCANIGVKLEADSWLVSVEEIDRRTSRQKDAARTARRKMMMGYALSHDSANKPSGVFIDPSVTEVNAEQQPEAQPAGMTRNTSSETLNRAPKKAVASPPGTGLPAFRPLSYYSSPFVGKIIHFIRRNNIPFEYVDTWVPSQIPSESSELFSGHSSHENNKCRLCFAGSGTAEVQVPVDSTSPAVGLSDVELFDLNSFGLYSQKFSFDVGCGLPGRVYDSGVASWERGVHKAPAELFERRGGATQWGIQTVLGVPVASPSVGRIVVLFYSRLDRPNDSDLVIRMMEELTQMMPTPKWKLIVDLGVSAHDVDNTSQNAQIATELLNKLTTVMPQDQRSPLAEYLPGFSSIRLLLTTTAHSDRERALFNSVIECYKTYIAAGVSDRDAIWMTARDCMLPAKHMQISQLQPPQEVKYDGLSTYLSDAASDGQSRANLMGQAIGNVPLPFVRPNPSMTNGSAFDISGQGRGSNMFNFSPALQGIAPLNNQVDPLSGMSFEMDPSQLSASQFASLLQSDPSLHFSGM